MIELRNLTKIYGNQAAGVKALNDVSTVINEAEFTGVMGTSGCGKSTLLNIIALLDSQTSGTYILKDKDVSQLTAHQKAKLRNEVFGFVFQSFNLIAEMTALENVCLPLRYSSVPKKQWKTAGMNSLEALGISRLADKVPDKLSGGEQQRVAIARALVNNPQIIVADEPTGSLDSKTGLEIVGVLSQLCREHGKTVVMVTHDAKIASFTDRILNMSDGRIIEDAQLASDKDTLELFRYSEAKVR